jgi:hypothetical protein
VRPLSARRQTPTVPQTTIRLNIDQPLDVHAGIFAEIALNVAFILDNLTNAVHLVLAEILDLLEWINIRRSQNPKRTRVPDPVDVSKPDPRLLIAGQIDASYTCHARVLLSALSSFAAENGYASPSPAFCQGREELGFTSLPFTLSPLPFSGTGVHRKPFCG